jgi:hypothetical protein
MLLLKSLNSWLFIIQKREDYYRNSVGTSGQKYIYSEPAKLLYYIGIQTTQTAEQIDSILRHSRI